VDAAILPVPDASLMLNPGNRSTTSDEQGRFGFEGLDPGTYFVSASKAGFTPVQSSAEVVAGDEEPPATMIRLLRLPGSDPFVVALQWEGFMQCSFTVAIAFGTGCLIGGFTNDNSRRFDPVDSEPAFLQSELDWETTQALGTNLCMRHYASDGIGGEIVADDVCGPRPLVQMSNGTRMNETSVGSGQGIERVVWVDDFLVDTTLGLAFNQQFRVYTHLFYNFEPDEGWLFIRDGAHPLPP
jgi:hypothetical protein